MTDYNAYSMTLGEKALYTAEAAAVLFVLSYIFYRSIPASLALCPFALLYPGMKKKELIDKRKKDLNVQFKDMLYSLSSSLSAGKPVEAAFRDVLMDLEILYPDKNTPIIQEAEWLVRKIEMNETVESALNDFAKRSHIEDIENFADVFSTCKRSGGNIIEIIKNSSGIINDKIEIKQEIDTMLAERKFERKVLNIMPPVMISLLSMTAKDYMEPVFSTAEGRLIMTIAVFFLAAAYFISKKIMDIKLQNEPGRKEELH